MKLVGIESVTYGVDGLEVAGKFFEEWGLELLEKGRYGYTFITPENTTLLVRPSDDTSLPTAWSPAPPCAKSSGASSRRKRWKTLCATCRPTATSR